MAVTDDEVKQWLGQNTGATTQQIADKMVEYGVGFDQISRATGLGKGEVQIKAAKDGVSLDQRQKIAKIDNTGIPYDQVKAQQAKQAGGMLSTPTAASSATATPTTATPTAQTYAAAPIAAQTYTPNQSAATPWSVGNNQTVDSEVNRIMAQGSPLMDRANTLTLQQSSGRGLLNSSMAMGAATNAMIDSVMPMATQNASTNASAAQWNADNVTRNNQFNAGMVNDSGQFNATQTNRASEFNASEHNTMQREAEKLAVTKAMGELDANTKIKLAELQAAASSESSALNNYRAIADTTNQTINAIMTSASLTPEAKQQAVDSALMRHDEYIQFQDSITGLNLSELITYTE